MSTRRRAEYKLHYFNAKGRGELARLILTCKLDIVFVQPLWFIIRRQLGFNCKRASVILSFQMPKCLTTTSVTNVKNGRPRKKVSLSIDTHTQRVHTQFNWFQLFFWSVTFNVARPIRLWQPIRFLSHDLDSILSSANDSKTITLSIFRYRNAIRTATRSRMERPAISPGIDNRHHLPMYNVSWLKSKRQSSVLILDARQSLLPRLGSISIRYAHIEWRVHWFLFSYYDDELSYHMLFFAGNKFVFPCRHRLYISTVWPLFFCVCVSLFHLSFHRIYTPAFLFYYSGSRVTRLLVFWPGVTTWPVQTNGRRPKSMLSSTRSETD